MWISCFPFLSKFWRGHKDHFYKLHHQLSKKAEIWFCCCCFLSFFFFLFEFQVQVISSLDPDECLLGQKRVNTVLPGPHSICNPKKIWKKIKDLVLRNKPSVNRAEQSKAARHSQMQAVLPGSGWGVSVANSLIPNSCKTGTILAG